jgi:glycosyltransferase involved in cell wall biosynthesis
LADAIGDRPPLRVGVNLLWLVPGVVGGSEEYATRLLMAVAHEAPADVEPTLFALEPFADAHPHLAARFPLVVCPLDGSSKASRVVAESTWLALNVRRQRVDLVHHVGGTIPPVRTAPAVVTIHDLQPLLRTGTFSVAKQAYLRWRLPASVREARRVMAVSEFVRGSIVQRFRIHPRRIDVVSSGVTPGPPVPTPLRELRDRFRLTGPWFVYPAITYPHKNHDTLVRAFARVTAARPDALLVLTHRADAGENDLEALVRRLGLVDNVRRVGRVSRTDLDGLIGGAVALVFPSRYEGFGLPVLEAMAAGCPVVAADAAALPEVVGDAGILLPPNDARAWATAMLELLADGGRRAALSAAGRERAACFDWATSAQRLLDCYRRASGRA